MLTIKIKRIIFGYKIKAKYFNRIKIVIHALNPNIIVEKMRKEDLDYGYL